MCVTPIFECHTKCSFGLAIASGDFGGWTHSDHIVLRWNDDFPALVAEVDDDRTLVGNGRHDVAH